jgi:hypothetical protein
MYRSLRFAALVIALVAPRAVAIERVTDEQVKGLIQDIAKGFDTWKADLKENHLGSALITSSAGTMSLEKFLESFGTAVDNAKDRFDPKKNAANSEVVALLRLGSDVVLQQRRQGEAPRSTWVPLSSNLQALAHAYSLPWPVESMSVQAARLPEKELANKVEQMKSSANQLWDEKEQAVKNDKAISDTTRESLKKSVEQLREMADGVHSRIEDEKPAEVEVSQLLTQVKNVKETLTKFSLFSAGGAWRGIDSGAEALAREFALAKP